MKSGRSLTELAQEIERQAQSKKDYIADTEKVAMELTPSVADGQMHKLSLAMQNGNGGIHLGMTDLFHEQVAAKVGIPKTYYERMQKEAPALLVGNVNHWFQREPQRAMVRTLDGRARAFLSEKYRPLDHHDLAEAVLPSVLQSGCRVESAELTDRRLYLKAVTERITMEVKKGDVVQAGIVISNSEVGIGAVKVEPMVFRLVCLNGAIVNDMGVRKTHVGRAGAEFGLDGAEEFYRDETRMADDRAFWMKVVDVVRATLSEVKFRQIVGRWQEATEQKIDGNPVKVVAEVTKRFNLRESEGGGVLQHLIQGGDLSAYGLMNAITRTSQDVPDYDRATDLERLGPRILELPRQAWSELASIK